MPETSRVPQADLPLMVFDGDCAVCRAAVDRWRSATGSKLRYAPYQEVAAQFPQIGEREFRRAVHFIDADGTVSRGAAAVLKALATCGNQRRLWWLYTKLPPFAWVAELIYRLSAANRKPLAIVRRIWYGKDLKLPTYHIASALFLRLLGVIYLIAFVSLWTQVDGLIGDHGILPVKEYLDAVDHNFAQSSPPASPVWNLPTLAWISPHAGFLNFLCGAGALLSILLILGLLPLPMLILLWLSYLSLVHAGQIFMGFQWDILLLETGFAAIFLAPFAWRSKWMADRHPPRFAVWLLWWLLFRLMFESGAVKLTWNTWSLEPDGLPSQHVEIAHRARFSLLDATVANADQLVRRPIARVVSETFGGVRAGCRAGNAVADFWAASGEICRLRRNHAVNAADLGDGKLQLFQSADGRFGGDVAG